MIHFTDRSRASWPQRITEKQKGFTPPSVSFLIAVIFFFFYWPLVLLIFFLTTMFWARLHLVLISMHEVYNQRRWHIKARKGAVNLRRPRVVLQWKSGTCCYQMTSVFLWFNIKTTVLFVNHLPFAAKEDHMLVFFYLTLTDSINIIDGLNGLAPEKVNCTIFSRFFFHYLSCVSDSLTLITN